ncbi:putative proteasome maturation factor Ump1 [Helianthus annuus]|nr:putative proteasome maturation factor Ump1 [Helianthus annuus]
MLGLESLTGALEDFGVEDYLQGNDTTRSQSLNIYLSSKHSTRSWIMTSVQSWSVHDTETMRAPDMHHGMEVRVGLSKGPVHPSFM